MNIQFRHLETFEERSAVYPLYCQLNATLSETEFANRMKDIMDTNYKLLAIFNADELIAISGYWISHKLYSGKYLEPDNVVVDEKYRSTGMGELLQKELEKIALENGCRAMMLDAYLENHRGHSFYERHSYIKKGYHFVKLV